MDINQSTISGIINAIARLLVQGGVHDPSEKITDNVNRDIDDEGLIDISNSIVLVHSDLGTVECVQSILK